MAGNCMQGNGKEDLGNGYVYDGHFDNYLPDGDGRLFLQGELIYAGQWNSGFPADENVSFFAKEDGTTAPVSEGFGPNFKAHGGSGSNKVLAGIGKMLRDASDRKAGRFPRP